jgi:hypothetical protein
MATETRHDKKVRINLDVPLTSVVGPNPKNRTGYGKYNKNNQTEVFHGDMQVPAELAEDLLRRQREYHEYEQGLIRDNGHKDVNAGQIMGSQA